MTWVLKNVKQSGLNKLMDYGSYLYVYISSIIKQELNKLVKCVAYLPFIVNEIELLLWDKPI